MAWHHAPVPTLHDEFSNLLMADTLRHGRLANAPPTLWQPFQSLHILVNPSYASKYPIGPGALLALGWTLWGAPAAGIWLGAALCCAAITWAAGGCVPRRWALLAGLLVSLSPNVHHEWSLSFMNGWSTSTASALVAGAILRLRKRTRCIDACVLGIGVGGLALTRPAEGFLFTLTAGGLLLWWWRPLNWKEQAARLIRIMPWAGMPVAVALLLIAIQNVAVTGKLTTMAYQLHEKQYGVAPLNIFQAPHEPQMFQRLDDVPPSVRNFHYGWSLQSYYKRNHFAGWCSAVAERLHVVTRLWGWPLCLLTGAMLISSCRRYWPLAITIGIALFVSSFIPWYFTHYFAPSLVWLVILTTVSVYWLSKRLSSDRNSMKWLVSCVLLVQLILVVAEVAAANRRDYTWADHRQKLVNELCRSGGEHLILVRYASAHNVHHEWVYNEADLENAAVLWAHSWRSDLDEQLLEHYRGRHVWYLEIDADDHPPLRPIAGPRVPTVSPGRAERQLPAVHTIH